MNSQILITAVIGGACFHVSHCLSLSNIITLQESKEE